MNETQRMAMQCCLCGEPTPETEALAISVTSANPAVVDGASQQLFAHGDCLANVLDPSVPFDIDAFSD